MVSALCARSKNRTKLKTKEERSERRVRAITCSTWFFLGMVFVFQDVVSLYSSVVERQSCKLKVLGSIPSGGFFVVVGMTPLTRTCHRLPNKMNNDGNK
jgi:hypothetical protein